MMPTVRDMELINEFRNWLEEVKAEIKTVDGSQREVLLDERAALVELLKILCR